MGFGKRHFLRYLCWAVVILYASGIFLLSGQNGVESDGLSTDIVKEVKQGVSTAVNIPGELNRGLPYYNHVFRKIAHFLEYMLLSALIYIALGFSRLRPWKAASAALLLSLIYAAGDEFHQKFVPGRSPRLMDVGIDSLGALAGLIAVFIIRALIRRLSYMVGISPQK